jgi:ATP-dependent Lon protease
VPSRNEKDLEEVPKDVLGELKVHLIKRIDEVLPLVLEEPSATAPATPTDGSSSVPPPKPSAP